MSNKLEVHQKVRLKNLVDDVLRQYDGIVCTIVGCKPQVVPKRGLEATDVLVYDLHLDDELACGQYQRIT